MDLALDDLIKKKPQRAKQEPVAEKKKPRGRVDPLNTSLDTLISSTGRRQRKSPATAKRRNDVRVIKPSKRRAAESPRSLPRNRPQPRRQQADPRSDRRPRRGPVILLPAKRGQNLSIDARKMSSGASRTYGLASVASTRLSAQALSQVAKDVKGRRTSRPSNAQRRKAGVSARGAETHVRSERDNGDALVVRKRSKSPPRRLTEAERLMASKIKVMAQLDKVPTPSLSQKRFIGSSTVAGVVEDRSYQMRSHASEPLTLSDRFSN